MCSSVSSMPFKDFKKSPEYSAKGRTAEVMTMVLICLTGKLRGVLRACASVDGVPGDTCNVRIRLSSCSASLGASISDDH